MITLDEIIGKSGDSELLDLKYDCAKNLLEFTLDMDMDEFNTKMSFQVVTREIRFGKVDADIKVCRLELISLTDELTINNGIYVPSNDFPKLMQETKKGFNLVYGKRINEVSHILSLVGVGKIFVASIENKEAIRFFDTEKV